MHNDTNVLALGADYITTGEAIAIVRMWIGTEFEGGRHKERLDIKVSLLVAEQMEEYKSDIIRMDRFTEYFPTVISLIALASILYFIFGT